MIRDDHSDTGRPVTLEPRRPRYTGSDLVSDAVGVLEGYELVAAHVVGVSAGGAFAQLLALGFPDRVLSLVLIRTSPAIRGERSSLPSATMFPLAHGQALAEEIPGARLLTLQGAGHGVDRADWKTIARAILEHTALRE